MRRAEIIVARLLEDTGELPREASAGEVVVGDGKTVRHLPWRVAMKQFGGNVNQAIEQGWFFIFSPDPDEVVVYSKAIPIPISTDDLQMAMSDLGVFDDKSAVAWARSTDIRPAPANWQKVFGATGWMDRSQKETERMQKEIERDQKKEQKQEPAPEQKPASPAVRTVLGQPQAMPPAPKRHNFDIGFGYAKAEGQNGIEVKFIHPSSPAARSNLERGDIIVAVGPFWMTNNEQSAYLRIRNTDELRQALGWLMPGQAFQMTVVRGGQEHQVVVVPQEQPQEWPEEGPLKTATPAPRAPKPEPEPEPEDTDLPSHLL